MRSKIIGVLEIRAKVYLNLIFAMTILWSECFKRYLFAEFVIETTARTQAHQVSQILLERLCADIFCAVLIRSCCSHDVTVNFIIVTITTKLYTLTLNMSACKSACRDINFKRLVSAKLLLLANFVDAIVQCRVVGSVFTINVTQQKLKHGNDLPER